MREESYVSGDSRQGSRDLRPGRPSHGQGAVRRHHARGCLEYLPETQAGEYVLVHVGFAISRVDEAEAERTYQALKELDQLNELDTPAVDESEARSDGKPFIKGRTGR